MSAEKLWRILRVALPVFILLLLNQAGPAPLQAQDNPDYRQQAEELLNAMTPAERVGQLFLVTFEGDRATADGDIADLVLNHHIGGVALQSENNNFTGYGDTTATVDQVVELTNNLQRLALLGYSEDPSSVEVETDAVPPSPVPIPVGVPVPLIVATTYEGDPLPVSNFKEGVVNVPNQMAISATWQPSYARQVGELVGRQLLDAGINLLLGPSLDVLERPTPFSPSDLGTNTFGGDPYWVGQMGRAYTEGVHAGSGNRVAVAARHFPGKGSSDRPVYEEIPTVRRSLEQLKQIDLAPFFAVTRDPLGQPTTADALLTTHIRYQGFQGNIRATTAPVSFDPQALNALLALPEFTNWRQAGGLVVSDALGVQSVEQLYDETGQDFPHRQVAKDALLAGNDLLYVAQFALGDAPYETQLTNVKDTILWFQEKYQSDPSFQQRVDDAALRILQAKLRLYGGDFSAGNVLVTSTSDQETQAPSTNLFGAAQSAVTLLAPAPAELSSRLTNPPGNSDKLVIFTDVREAQQCRTCPPQPLLSHTALAERILALYGPDGSAQVRPENIESFSFSDLDEYLAAGTGPIPPPATPITPTIDLTQIVETVTAETLPTPEESPTPEPTPTIPAAFRVQQAMQDADWVIFAMLDAGANADSIHARAINRLLAQRPDLIRNRTTIAFAFDAPYFLDSTEISKLTAYYGIYSRTNDFVDAAVRALFLESPLSGAAPVSVEGTQYDLFLQTQPNPAQLIELYFVFDGEAQSPGAQEPVAAEIGDTLNLRTGVIRDRNGHPVPDGTLVRFILRDRIQGTVTIIGDRPTTNGVAELAYVLEARMGPGQFRITAESGEATLSQEVDISIEDDAQLAIIVPTQAPTPLPTETATPSPTATATLTPEPPTPTATVAPPAPVEEDRFGLDSAELRTLLLVLVGLATVGFISLILTRDRKLTATQRLGRPLWGIVGGLLLYNYYALGLPGTGVFGELGSMGGLLTTLVGGAIGLALYRPARSV